MKLLFRSEGIQISFSMRLPDTILQLCSNVVKPSVPENGEGGQADSGSFCPLTGPNPVAPVTSSTLGAPCKTRSEPQRGFGEWAKMANRTTHKNTHPGPASEPKSQGRRLRTSGIEDTSAVLDLLADGRRPHLRKRGISARESSASPRLEP